MDVPTRRLGGDHRLGHRRLHGQGRPVAEHGAQVVHQPEAIAAGIRGLHIGEGQRRIGGIPHLQILLEPAESHRLVSGECRGQAGGLARGHGQAGRLRGDRRRIGTGHGDGHVQIGPVAPETGGLPASDSQGIHPAGGRSAGKRAAGRQGGARRKPGDRGIGSGGAVRRTGDREGHGRPDAVGRPDRRGNDPRGSGQSVETPRHRRRPEHPAQDDQGGSGQGALRGLGHAHQWRQLEESRQDMGMEQASFHIDFTKISTSHGIQGAAAVCVEW